MKPHCLHLILAIAAAAFSGCESSSWNPFADSPQPATGDELVASGELAPPSGQALAPAGAAGPAAPEEREAAYLNAVPLSELDQPIRLTDRAPIEFPDEMRTKNKIGQVVLMITVGESGRVVDCRVAEADHSDIAEEVRAQMAERTFTPPMKGGEPVAAFGRMRIPYRIGVGNLLQIMKPSDRNYSPRR